MVRLLFLLAASALVAGGASAQPAGDWSRAAPLPTARSEMRAVAWDGRIYVPGGLGRLGSLGTFEVYDPARDAWRALPDLPEPVHHAGVGAADGRIFVSGGYRDLRFRPDHAALYAFDVAAERWQRLADMPAARAGHAVVALDGILYVVGGVGPSAHRVLRYDVRADRWLAAAADLPSPREHLDAVALDGRIWAVGGRWRDGNVGTVEVYDPQADAWEPGPALPTPRSGLAAAVVDGRIHVIGGEELSGGRTFEAHEIYDPSAASWIRSEEMIPGRHGLAAASVAGRMYVVGGATRAGAGTFVSLSALNAVWGPR